MSEVLEIVLRALRHPLAIFVALTAALSVVMGFAGGSGLLATFVGVGAGHVAGELLGRSRLRLPFALGIVVGVALLGGLLAKVVVGITLFAAILGGPATLHLAILLGWTAAFFGVVGSLRALVSRHPTWAGVELAAFAGAFALAFAPHRDGALARPLWLADAAWRMGFDPASALLAFGALFVVALGLVRLGESRRRLTLLSAAVVPLLALILVLLVDPAKLQQVDVEHPLDALDHAMDTPPPTAPKAASNSKDDGLPPKDGQGSPHDGEPEEGEDGQQPQDGQRQPQDAQGGEKEQQAQGGVDRGEKRPDGTPAKGSSADGKGAAAGAGGTSQPKEGEGGQAAKEQPDVESGSSGGKTAPVAVVLLDDDYEPPSGGFYLRQEAWSEYDGHRLVASKREGSDPDVVDHFPTVREALPTPPAEHRQRVRGRVSVLVEHRLPFGLETPVAYDTLRNPNPARFQRSWRFESSAQTIRYDQLFGKAPGDAAWTKDQWELYTEIPSDPRYADLAKQIRDGMPDEWEGDAFAQALAVKVHLDDTSRYSTSERHAGAEDPTADYLFGNHIGYCVHTAHAAVYLWRELGLPARVGAGYMVEAADRRGAALLVMNKDAHAWPEVYLDGVGWVVLDIAPKENLDPPGQPLDEDLTALLADMADEPPPDDREPLVDYAALRRLATRAAGVLAVMFTVAVLAAHAFVKSWRRVRPLWASPSAQPRVSYRTALDLLAEVGVVRGDGETRERFARRVREQYPTIEPLTAMHLAGRLGDPKRKSRPETDPAAWRRHLRALRDDIVRSRGRLRRWIGILDVFSFWRAR